MIATKIVVYGNKDGGKYVTVMRLMRDNPFLSEPYVIKSMENMKHFLSTPTRSLAIVTAPSVDHIVKRCAGMNLGSVLFIADPTATEQAGEELISDVVWNGSSASELIEKLHAK